MGYNMDSRDPAIICFQHLKEEPKCFCFNLPKLCRFCNCDLMNSELNTLPFQVPCPFKSSSEVCNSVVIRPTFGDFLSCHENFSSLHIGVTDSRGSVFEYDASGLMITSRSPSWELCLPIKILQPSTTSVKRHWDIILHDIILNNCWTKDRYNPESYNCYSFVLSFLQSLRLTELKPFVTDKVTFCEQYVCPQTRIASKYLTIFRKLKQNSSSSCIIFDE